MQKLINAAVPIALVIGSQREYALISVEHLLSYHLPTGSGTFAIVFQHRGPLMIIYGTRGKSIPIEDGEFFCPRCDSEQEYRHFAVKNYFTLYFIPIFPIGGGDEYVECTGCSQTWSPDILHFDPETALEEAVTNYRRLAVLFLLDVGRCTSSTLTELKSVLDETFGVDVEKSEIANDVELAQSASPDTRKFFKTETAELDADDKLLLVQILKRCLEAEGYIPDLEQQRIVELGKVIGLKAKQVQAILNS